MKKLEIIKRRIGYTVIVDGKFADCLGPDEALGVVASSIFSEGEPIFVKNYESWVAWEERFSRLDRSGQKLLPEV